ncbi:MAG: cysteine-rich CWC family protein [Burkholderiales bacterium]
MDQSDKYCAECGAAFICENALGKPTCWCSRKFPAVMAMKNAGSECYCPVCLEKKIAAWTLEASAQRGAG